MSGNDLRVLREMLNFTQEDIAAILEVSQNSISRIEGNRVNYSVTARKYERYFQEAAVLERIMAMLARFQQLAFLCLQEALNRRKKLGLTD